MADIKGHALLNQADDLQVGTDQVTAVYLGETLVWPSPIFLMEMLYLPDPGD